jgi:hypothetical protein
MTSGSTFDGASSVRVALPLSATELREIGYCRYEADLPEEWTALPASSC